MDCIPAIWRQVKVVFMPNPGRNSYTGPRDLRPISLTLFLPKTLERLVDRYLRDGALVVKPLYPSQHAYQAGKSIDTALHQLSVRVEKVLDRQELTSGVFLDIEGAYNYTSFDSVWTAICSRGVNSIIVQWIRATLEGRLATVTPNDFSVRVAVARGCLQGGVLSPLLWCLVVDDLMARLNMGGMYCQGYADDICLLAVGKFLNMVLELMQRALHTLETWCGEVGLLVNPDKTNLVVFMKKRKLFGFFEPLLFGVTVHHSELVRYLGVTLDSRLTWWEHVNDKVVKPDNSLWACRRSFGAVWGLQPRLVYWLHTSVIRPSITFAS
jgi:hypothetical protein